MDYLEIAKVCHGAVRALCEAHGDNSIKEWYDAEDWQRKAAIDGVAEHHAKWFDCKPLVASDSHDTWMAQKIADGWVYGPEKDGTLKTHPCLVPFHELPQHQQMKDVLFGVICYAYFDRE